MLNFFKRKKELKAVFQDENAIVMAIGPDGKTTLRLSVQNIQGEESSEHFAKALFAIQSGVFREQIEELIAEFAYKSTGPSRTFMEETLGFYTIYFDMVNKSHYNKSDKPVVSPLKFSSLVMNGDK